MWFMGFWFFPCVRDGLIRTSEVRACSKESEAELTTGILCKGHVLYFSSLFFVGWGDSRMEGSLHIHFQAGCLLTYILHRNEHGAWYTQKGGSFFKVRLQLAFKEGFGIMAAVSSPLHRKLTQLG